MIQRIICPVDFSTAALNATQYAANLANTFGAQLLLLNVQKIIPVAAAVSLGEGIDAGARRESVKVSHKLKEVALDLERKYSIVVNQEVDITVESLANAISSHSSENTMVVIGSNGFDNGWQFYFGTNSFNVINKAKGPVLVVPEEYLFTSYKNILYIISLDKEEENRLLKYFFDFVKDFDVNVTFLCISEKPTDLKSDDIRMLKQQIEKYNSTKGVLKYEFALSEDVFNTIDRFASKYGLDLLVVKEQHRSLIERLLKNKSIVSQLSLLAQYPMLVYPI